MKAFELFAIRHMLSLLVLRLVAVLFLNRDQYSEEHQGAPPPCMKLCLSLL